ALTVRSEIADPSQPGSEARRAGTGTAHRATVSVLRTSQSIGSILVPALTDRATTCRSSGPQNQVARSRAAPPKKGSGVVRGRDLALANTSVPRSGRDSPTAPRQLFLA